MRDILLKHNDSYIECEINGLELIYTYSDDPKRHYVLTLRDENSYARLKNEMRNIYESYDDKLAGYDVAAELLESADRCEYFTNDMGHTYCDLRDEDEILSYHKEAADKVWLMRSCCISTQEPEHEASRPAMERILNTYNDIPKDGYDMWECGYWNGIMGALRWVLGDDRDFLDT